MSKTVLLEDVKNPVTSADWEAKVKYLRQQARLAAQEVKKAAHLEAIQREEEQKKQQIADAFKMLDIIKTLRMQDGRSAYDWALNELKKSKASEAQNAEKRTPSRTTNQPEKAPENGVNGEG